MGCFFWPGESFIGKKAFRKRNNSSNVNHRRSKSDGDLARPRMADCFKICTTKFGNKKSKVVSHGNGLKSPSPKINIDGFKVDKFSLSDLVAATENFKEENFLGEGGFGKVYKGCLKYRNEIVAIKQLDPNGIQGIREFVAEVLTLSKADHTNLVKLIGYCAEGDQKLLVYEYMPLGSLEDHLHGSRTKRKELDWNKRIKIAVGAATGLEYLHTQMSPPVIYRDLKCSNILLGEEWHPKLSDFGLAKEGPSGDDTHVSTRVMGTYGYCAPEYAMTGQLTFRSDIYSFGVVLLEIITGRRAIDHHRAGHDQTLVEWAKPFFKERAKFHLMADPMLEGKYPVRGMYQVVAIAAMCTQDQPSMRPQIADIVQALAYLSSQKYDPMIHPVQKLGKFPSAHKLRMNVNANTNHGLSRGEESA